MVQNMFGGGGVSNDDNGSVIHARHFTFSRAPPKQAILVFSPFYQQLLVTTKS